MKKVFQLIKIRWKCNCLIINNNYGFVIWHTFYSMIVEEKFLSLYAQLIYLYGQNPD